MAKAIMTLCWLVAADSFGFGTTARAVNTKPLVEIVRVPNNGIAPQAATDERGRLHLIYFSGDPTHGDIFYVHSDDGGKTLTTPVRVNSQPESAIAIGTVRVPQMAVGRNGRVHVAWMGSGKAELKSGAKQTPMLYTRTTDAGDAFEPQKNVITQRPGLDGGGSVAADSLGNVYVAWHAPKNENTEADRWVWVARSENEGKTFAAETAANPKPTGACGCCGMKISVDHRGDVYVAYRSAMDIVNRDMILLVSMDHAKTFATAAVDPWTIAACAMSTSSLGGSASKTIGAWETKGHVRYFVALGDRKVTELSSVPGRSAKQKHPAVAVNGSGQFLVAWTEGTGWNKGGLVAWQVFDRDGGAIEGQSGQVDGLPAWSMPAAFTRPDGTFGIAY